MDEEKLQRLALEECNVIFVDKLNVSAILPHLISRHLLTDNEKELLTQFTRTNSEKVQYLLDIIPRKEKGWFELFIECLRESSNGTGHRDLVKELETKFQEQREKNLVKNKRIGGKRFGKQRSDESQQPVAGASGGVGQNREDVYTIFLESSGNHSVHTFNVRGSDTVGSLMDKARHKLNVDHTKGIRLLSGAKELKLQNSLVQSNVHKNGRVVMVVVTHGGQLLEQNLQCF